MEELKPILTLSSQGRNDWAEQWHVAKTLFVERFKGLL